MRVLQLSEMTTAGVELSRKFFADLRNGVEREFPSSILSDPRYRKVINADIEIAQNKFSSKREAGQYLDEQIGQSGSRDVSGNYPLWF